MLGSPDIRAPRALTPSLSHHCVEGCRSPGEEEFWVTQHWWARLDRAQLLDRLQGKHPHFRKPSGRLLQDVWETMEKLSDFLERNCNSQHNKMAFKNKNTSYYLFHWMSLTLSVWPGSQGCCPSLQSNDCSIQRAISWAETGQKGQWVNSAELPSQTQTLTRRLCAQWVEWIQALHSVHRQR